MGLLQDALDTIGATAKGWEVEAEDTYGLDANLICPEGCVIEQDGSCEHGESPLRAAGLI